MFRSFLIHLFLLTSYSLIAQNEFSNKFYVNLYIQGLIQEETKPVALKEYDVNFLQNFPIGISSNYEITSKIILRSSLRLNMKKIEVLYNYGSIEGEKYFFSDRFIDRNIKVNTLDFSIGVGYKYQYGRNVVIPYLDFRFPFHLKDVVENYEMKEIGTNNKRIYDMDLSRSGVGLSFEAGLDYQLHFTADRGFFGSVGYRNSNFPYRLNTAIDNSLYEDQIISNSFKLIESGFFVSAGCFYSFGKSFK